MGNGGYNGGSTIIGPRSAGWFGKGGGKGSSKKWPKKGNPNAIAAAIHRHEQNLETEYYALLAASLRDAGFTEREVRRGLTIQRAKNKKKRAHGLPMNFAQ